MNDVFQIFYWVEGTPRSRRSTYAPSHVKTVAATETSATLDQLKMYTQYSMVMLAFNAAGDGPNTTVPITTTTQEGGQLDFHTQFCNLKKKNFKAACLISSLIGQLHY